MTTRVDKFDCPPVVCLVRFLLAGVFLSCCMSQSVIDTQFSGDGWVMRGAVLLKMLPILGRQQHYPPRDRRPLTNSAHRGSAKVST